MAKRRRLETPSSADLDRIEAQFRSETFERPALGRGIAPPIAQVAADSAALSSAESVEGRAARARADADAARLHDAQERGLLIVELPIEQIDEGAMIRDRMVMSEEDMQELRLSIAAHGLRLPIEVFEIDRTEGQGPRYGLLSGYRRLHAVRALHELTQAEKHATIRALIRPRTETDEAFVAMVEENEVREELSHFERGRIAVIAANQGAFANTEDAVNKLFATGSKAKRSKVRSFALIFEELGDMLRFPEALTERRGLRLATALRNGAEARLRQSLSVRIPGDADEEWALIEPVLQSLESNRSELGRAGRPRSNAPRQGWSDAMTRRTQGGVEIRWGRDGKAHILRLEGDQLDDDLMERLVREIQALLDG
ncbi:ParB N-terminal domain-containing protein [Paracoccus sp. FO-3]|uniref:ParB/RepB/Spo0J family partition protein n=1 Tax=Paracoccus sp. FO-3 TaxID=1335059 RepID=UPI00112C2DED|nr:ParB N-terminal domain-containing protein [Paracoccus sp. FO-3]